ncbi:hypothetical protein JNUCC42_13340 [Brevibacterium sp. JNUCC-42]|nr:hypothetical protein JNUCC42_13340 [Brevibacterium sp. JNUCC-42]
MTQTLQINNWKRFVAGVNWRSWCIGLQIHDFREECGCILIEINLLPVLFLLRLGDGTKLLRCTRCKKVLDRVNVDEDYAAKCLDCYYGF